MSKRKLDLIHHKHKMQPCCEHVGESAGDLKRSHRRIPEESHTGFSCSSSTLTCEETSVSGTCSQQKDDDGDTCWTDDRHSSYLSCMEKMFVRNMYDREYCSLDICGHGESAPECEQDCVESKLPSSFFKVMQGGGWQPLPCRRLHSWEVPSPGLMSSPWIQHFKAKVKPADDTSTKSTDERLICKTSTAYDLEEDDNAAEVPDVENRSSAWFERINCHSTATTTASSHPLTGKSSILESDPTAAAGGPIHKSSTSKYDPIDQVVPLANKCKRWFESEKQEIRSSRMNLVRRRY